MNEPEQPTKDASHLLLKSMSLLDFVSTYYSPSVVAPMTEAMQMKFQAASESLREFGKRIEVSRRLRSDVLVEDALRGLVHVGMLPVPYAMGESVEDALGKFEKRLIEAGKRSKDPELTEEEKVAKRIKERKRKRWETPEAYAKRMRKLDRGHHG